MQQRTNAMCVVSQDAIHMQLLHMHFAYMLITLYLVVYSFDTALLSALKTT
jgi:hypothetical protein